ncbi:MAG: hypothetical protein CIT03_09975 [Methanobacterium sp.]|nr:MAG: hypothetical protein CIT03_09975 [Methanobacterium sp.]
MKGGSIMDTMDQDELLKIAFNKVNDIITIIEIKDDGRAGNFIKVNDVAVKKLGYSPEEFSQMSPRDIGSTPLENKKKIRELITQGRVYFQRNYFTKDGKTIPVEINSHIINLKNKKAALSVARDISDRQESEERLKDFFDNATDLIQMVNSDGTFLYVNEAWKDVLGYRDDEIQNLNIFDVIHPEHLEQCRDTFEKVFNGHKIDEIETGFKTKNGQEVVLEGNINPKIDDNGKVVYTRAIFRDVTERKHYEMEIQRLASIVESSGDAIVGYEMDGTIFNWNPGAEKIYGYSYDEIIGKNVSLLMKKEKWEENLKNIEKIKEGGVVSHFETTRFRKDGSTFDASISLSPIKNSQGEIIGISTIARDITGSKKAQKALKDSEEKYRRIVEKFIQNALALIGEINKE